MFIVLYTNKKHCKFFNKSEKLTKKLISLNQLLKSILIYTTYSRILFSNKNHFSICSKKLF